MKFTQVQLIEFAKKAGVPVVEVVADEKDADYNEDTALQDVHKAITPIIKPKIEAEMTSDLETKLKGKHSGEMYSLLARESGLTRAELDKLSIGDAAKLAFTHIATKTGGDTAALQLEIKELVSKHAKALDDARVAAEGQVNEANQKYIRRDINSALAESVIAKAPLLETADKKFYTDMLQKHLEDKYHMTYDEAKKAVNLFKKDNHAVPALNEAGTATIDMLKEFESIAKPAGVWKTDNRQASAAEKMKQAQTQTYSKDTAPKVDGMRSRKRISSEEAVAAMEQMEK